MQSEGQRFMRELKGSNSLFINGLFLRKVLQAVTRLASSGIWSTRPMHSTADFMVMVSGKHWP